MSAPTPPPSKPQLHNFPLPLLKWGSSKTTHHPRLRRSPPKLEPEPETKTWDLRPRKPPPPTTLPPPTPPVTTTSTAPSTSNGKPLMRSSNGGTVRGNGGAENREKRKFWIALSRDEIEEDIYSFTGSKPSRRPKKHSKLVQKQLDNVFPGLWLVGITPEAYRGIDPPPMR